jgi:hypothetical protein
MRASAICPADHWLAPVTGLAGPAQPKKIKIIKNNKNCVCINKKYKYEFIIFYLLMPESE